MPKPPGDRYGQNLAVVRHELVFRVFRGDPALDGVAVARNVRLLRHVHFRTVQGVSLRDEDLRADEIEAGDHFGDGVLDLDARVHLDEEPLVLVEVVKEFDGAGVVVTNLAGDAGRRLAEFLDDALRQAEAGRDFHDLLVAALDGAIALMQMNHIAVPVAQDLDFNVLGALNVFLQEHGRVAERAFRFRLRFVQQAFQITRLVNDAHAAAAAAKGGFDDQRVADFLGRLQRGCPVGNRLFVAGQDRNIDLLGEFRVRPSCRPSYRATRDADRQK